MKKNKTKPTTPGRYKVSEAGEHTWVDVDAETPEGAGECWASENWRPSDGGITYELDVVTPEGNLVAVTVNVDYSVSFLGFATKHPAGDSLPGGAK